MEEKRSSGRDRNPTYSRREVLALGMAGVAIARFGSAASIRAFEPSADKAATSAGLIAGKDARLIVHNAKTLELETPVALLREHAVTPKELLFVRNNQTLEGSKTLAPFAGDDWSVELTGLVEFPRTITLARLRALPQVEQEVVLQCSGNGRALMSRAAPAQGAPWTRGAMANLKFRGPTLASVIETLAPHVDPAAKFVAAEGRDEAASDAAADFEHSLPLADAMARSLLALEMNGEPLPAAHGGPVRFVTPGYYGTMHVKWLGELRFEAEETFNHHQTRRYRTPREPIPPGSEFHYSQSNSEANWRMRIKSVIFAPLDGEKLAAGNIVVSGIAFNDGAAEIDSVVVSADGGKHWRSAELTPPSGPYGWYRWQTNLELAAGAHEILVRAVDRLGRTQPLEAAVQWNPAGYGFSAADRVRVEVA